MKYFNGFLFQISHGLPLGKTHHANLKWQFFVCLSNHSLLFFSSCLTKAVGVVHMGPHAMQYSANMRCIVGPTLLLSRSVFYTVPLVSHPCVVFKLQWYHINFIASQIIRSTFSTLDNWWPVDSPRKVPVIRKSLPWHSVIMKISHFGKLQTGKLSSLVNPSMDNFPKCPNGCSLEVWEWVCNFIRHFIMAVITCPPWDYSYPY